MPRKGENIYKRKDGRWEARYIKQRTPDGKAVYGYVYAKSYKEAKSKVQKCLIAVANSCATSVSSQQHQESSSFECVANEWYTSILPQVKESTSNKYRNLLDSYIVPLFGKLSLAQLSFEIIEEGANQLLTSGGKSGTGLSAKTVADTLSVIRNILKYAARSGHTVKCEVSSIQIKRNPQEMRVLSRGEQERLCKYLYSDLCACNIGILLSLFTGIRIGELCALKWEDISLQEQTMHIRQTMQRIQDRSGVNQKTKIVVTAPKSACSIRTIPLPGHLVKIIAEYRTTDTGFFLTNSNMRYIEPRTMQNKFQKALKNCSIESVNFHTLRHTFATRCVELGFDVKSLSEILGHASVNITMNRYVHPSLDLKKKNMQRLSELFAVN